MKPRKFHHSNIIAAFSIGVVSAMLDESFLGKFFIFGFACYFAGIYVQSHRTPPH